MPKPRIVSLADAESAHFFEGTHSVVHEVEKPRHGESFFMGCRLPRVPGVGPVVWVPEYYGPASYDGKPKGRKAIGPYCEWGFRSKSSLDLARLLLEYILKTHTDPEIEGAKYLEAATVEVLLEDFFVSTVLTLPKSKPWVLPDRYLHGILVGLLDHRKNERLVALRGEELRAAAEGRKPLSWRDPGSHAEVVKQPVIKKPAKAPSVDSKPRSPVEWTPTMVEDFKAAYAIGIPANRIWEYLGLTEAHKDAVHDKLRELHDKERSLPKKGRIHPDKLEEVIRDRRRELGLIEEQPEPAEGPERELSDFEESSLRVLAAAQQVLEELQTCLIVHEGEGADLTNPVVADVMVTLATEERFYQERGLL